LAVVLRSVSILPDAFTRHMLAALLALTPESSTAAGQVNLHKELVAQLKAEGIKVTLHWSPTKKYAAYKTTARPSAMSSPRLAQASRSRLV
jgi:hypothetical protein